MCIVGNRVTLSRNKQDMYATAHKNTFLICKVKEIYQV